jgi:hypothetical protein
VLELAKRWNAVITAAAGGLSLGFHLPQGAAAAAADAPTDGAEVNAWVVIKPDGHLRDPHRPHRNGQSRARQYSRTSAIPMPTPRPKAAR